MNTAASDDETAVFCGILYCSVPFAKRGIQIVDIISLQYFGRFTTILTRIGFYVNYETFADGMENRSVFELVNSINTTTIQRKGTYMRRTYKERKYYCGEYMEVDIFPIYTHSKRRNARKKPTTEIQKQLNRKHSEGKLRRLLHTNFNQSDLFVTLTFNNDTLPATVEDAQRLLQNFLRRVKRVYGKMGKDVKYIYVLEYGTKHNRLHIHLVMSGGISREALAKLWGLGAVSSGLLHFGKDGLAALARYLTKGSEDDDRLTWKRWSGSRNLDKPRVSEREGRVSHRKMTDLCQNGGEADYLESQFNGYEMADFAPVVYEDIYGGYYLSVMMKKQTTRTDAWSDFEGLPF